MLRVAFDVGVEHGRRKGAVQLITLKLRHVDAVGRKTAERFIERCRNIPYLKHETCDDGAVFGIRILRLARHLEKARRVVARVLHIRAQQIEPVDFRRAAWWSGRDGGLRAPAELRCSSAPERVSARKRLVANLGTKNLMILRNHGLLACGESVAACFANMWLLQRSCEIQMATDAGRGAPIPIGADVRAASAKGLEVMSTQAGYGRLELAALLRQIDLEDPSYRQ